MVFEPVPHDVHVFKTEDGAQGVRLQYFARPSIVSRIVVDGEPWLRIDFIEGGRVEFPEAVMVWIEPERH